MPQDMMYSPTVLVSNEHNNLGLVPESQATHRWHSERARSARQPWQAQAQAKLSTPCPWELVGKWHQWHSFHIALHWFETKNSIKSWCTLHMWWMLDTSWHLNLLLCFNEVILGSFNIFHHSQPQPQPYKFHPMSSVSHLHLHPTWSSRIKMRSSHYQHLLHVWNIQILCHMSMCVALNTMLHHAIPLSCSYCFWFFSLENQVRHLLPLNGKTEPGNQHGWHGWPPEGRNVDVWWHWLKTQKPATLT